MADTELSSKLYEKMSAEQDKFRAWLVEQPPADILLHAVEYAVREDILIPIYSCISSQRNFGILIVRLLFFVFGEVITSSPCRRW